jgi:hypothetical protein
LERGEELRSIIAAQDDVRSGLSHKAHPLTWGDRPRQQTPITSEGRGEEAGHGYDHRLRHCWMAWVQRRRGWVSALEISRNVTSDRFTIADLNSPCLLGLFLVFDAHLKSSLFMILK